MNAVKHLHYFFKGASLFLCQFIVYTSFAQVEVQWEKNAPARDVIATLDNNYLLVGSSGETFGTYDYHITKINQQGNTLWEKTYGGSESDRLVSVVSAPDGGYLLGGNSQSGDSYEKSQPSRGGLDYWVVRIDASGNKIWDKTFGGNAMDELKDVAVSESGQYLLFGTSTSDVSGDKRGPIAAGQEFWAVQVDDEGNKQWDKSLGESTVLSVATTAVATPDDGYIVAGFHFQYYDSTDNKIIRLDAMGNIVWEDNKGGNLIDIPTDIAETLNLTSFKKGIYYLKVVSQQGITTKRVVIE